MLEYSSSTVVKPELPELPSSKFQYSLWHDLKSNEIYGDKLKAPRVRIGPSDQDIKTYLQKIHNDDDDNDDDDDNKWDIESVHHDLKGKDKSKHRDKLENWEKAELASFGYQEKNDGYQKKNLYRILTRLKNVKYLNLAHNNITDLHSFSFPHCTYVNLNNNYISSLKFLPQVKSIIYLTLMDNDISTLDGLNKFKAFPIEELYLNGNPVTFTNGYRQSVFAVLPQLKVLDGVYKLKTDLEVIEDETKPSSCIIS